MKSKQELLPGATETIINANRMNGIVTLSIILHTNYDFSRWDAACYATRTSNVPTRKAVHSFEFFEMDDAPANMQWYAKGQALTTTSDLDSGIRAGWGATKEEAIKAAFRTNARIRQQLAEGISEHSVFATWE